ncbi:MAG: hypothetical protein ACRELV_14000, partial [Longimicrobiales bacterium]
MRFTTYTKYKGGLLDALNLQDLLDRLADFLLDAGFAGGPHHNPWWGVSGDEADRSMEALKEALLRALIESGQLTEEMLAELRGEGEGDEAVRQEIADLLDDLVQRLIDEGYLSAQQMPQVPGSATELTPGQGTIDEQARAARQVDFKLTQKGLDFLAYRTLRQLLQALGQASHGSHETAMLATGIESEAVSRQYQFGDTLNLDIPATLTNALKRQDTGVPIDIDYPDLMVHLAEYRSSCATVLMLVVSHSMILYGEDRFTPAKKVALALSHLIRTQYPGDTLHVLTFGDRAEEIPLGELHGAQVGPYHTNTAEGFKLARRILGAQKKDM